MLYRQLLPK